MCVCEESERGGAGRRASQPPHLPGRGRPRKRKKYIRKKKNAMDDFERAVLFSFDVTGAVGPELKVRARRAKEAARARQGLAARSFAH